MTAGQQTTRIPRYTLAGVRDAEVSAHPFATEDGLGLDLTRFHRADCDNVVLLIHGLTVSSDMFIMPEHENLVNFLLDSGFTDVWTLDFRVSNRFPYDAETHRFNFDDIALYDFPPALAELRRNVGDRQVHVIAHCAGSLAFSMSLFGGAVDGIASLVASGVSLTTRMSTWSRAKLTAGPALTEYVLGLPFLDPRYGEAPVFTRGWLLSRFVSLFHRECDERPCHMISFMWGKGHPALYEHANLSPETHRRVADLFGACGVHYYRHARKMVKAGHAVKYDSSDPRYADLPNDYLANAADIATPILFLAGDHNHVFPGANVACHKMLEKIKPGLHELEILPGYGHIDAFIGKNSHIDVFPKIVDFLKRKAA
jgi:pimeloyl-ACP methyl ester carboxylesterase